MPAFVAGSAWRVRPKKRFTIPGRSASHRHDEADDDGIDGADVKTMVRGHPVTIRPFRRP